MLADLALTSAPSSSTLSSHKLPPGHQRRDGGRRTAWNHGSGRSRGGGGGAAVVVLRQDHLGRGMHYSRNAPHSELGEAVVERRLLALAGWRVVTVPRHLWKVWEQPEEQLMYLYAKLAEADDERG